VLCGAGARGNLCAGCDENLPWLNGPRCTRCSAPLPENVLCGTCLTHPPAYDDVTAAFVYAHPVDALIQGFKYGGRLALGTVLANALRSQLREPAELMIPMPLAATRLRERGFNQALELARQISRGTGIPLSAHACRKVRETLPQAMLPWKERAANVRRVFVCDENLADRHVAIVDDVMTTGTTLNELAGNLRRAGARRVSCWVVARAVRRGFTGAA